MIQLIVTWNGDWEVIESPYEAKAIVPEMVDNTYLILLNEPDDFDALEQEMEDQDDVFKVGAYNMDGTHYIYGNPNKNHTINKYKGKLKDVIDYDEEGNPIGSHPPTVAEALETQVNKIYGYASDRTLTDPE